MIITGAIRLLGLSDDVPPILVAHGWIAASLLNLSVAWIAGWINRRPGRSTLLVGLLVSLFTTIVLVGLIEVIWVREWDAVVLWTLTAWTMFIIWKYGLKWAVTTP